MSVLLGDSFNFSTIDVGNVALEEISGATASANLSPAVFERISNSSGRVVIVYNVFLNEGLFLRREEYLQENKLTDNKLASIVLGVHIVDGVRELDLYGPLQLMFLKHPVRS